MTTFNQINQAFADFASNHLQIHTFYSGQTFNFQPEQNIHPSMIVIPQPGNVEYGKITLTYSVLILDILNNDHSNLQEILSDTLQIITDMVAYFKNIDDFWIDESGVSVEPFEGVQDDDLAGWAASISIEMPFGGSPCGLPLSV